MPISIQEQNHGNNLFRQSQPYEFLEGELLRIVTNAIRSQDGFDRTISQRVETVLECHPAGLVVQHDLTVSEREILADWWRNFDRLNISKLRAQVYGTRKKTLADDLSSDGNDRTFATPGRIR